MGIKDNLDKFIASQRRKNAVNRIGKEAVNKGSVETEFMERYTVFTNQLGEVLEKSLVNNNDRAIKIKPKDIKSAGLYEYLVDKDEKFKGYYNIVKNDDGTYTFSINDELEDVIEGAD